MSAHEPKPVDVLAVTAEQAEQIEAAWRICSGGTRKITGAWVKRFDDCVATVLGFAPPAAYRLDTTAALARVQGGAA